MRPANPITIMAAMGSPSPKPTFACGLRLDFCGPALAGALEEDEKIELDVGLINVGLELRVSSDGLSSEEKDVRAGVAAVKGVGS